MENTKKLTDVLDSADIAYETGEDKITITPQAFTHFDLTETQNRINCVEFTNGTNVLKFSVTPDQAVATLQRFINDRFPQQVAA